MQLPPARGYHQIQAFHFLLYGKGAHANECHTVPGHNPTVDFHALTLFAFAPLRQPFLVEPSLLYVPSPLHVVLPSPLSFALVQHTPQHEFSCIQSLVIVRDNNNNNIFLPVHSNTNPFCIFFVVHVPWVHLHIPILFKDIHFIFPRSRRPPAVGYLCKVVKFCLYRV